MDWGIIAAQCQRFYMAADPRIWWQMSLQELGVFSGEIEPLQAAEKLDALSVARLAQADPKDSKTRLLIQSWENAAKRLGKVEQPKERKPTKQEYFAMLRATGVKMV